MSNFVSQSELTNFRRHATIIVDKSDNPCVEGALGALIHPLDSFRVSLKLFAYATRRTGSTSHPRETKGSACEVSIGKDVRQTKVLVVSERMDVQKVAHIDVLHAELIHFAIVRAPT